MKRPLRAPVSRRALWQRINRALEEKDQQLRAYGRTGTCFVVDLRKNVLVRPHVDLEALARELGVLKPFEELDPATALAFADANEKRRPR